jgi:serine/threonine protein kinase/Flp pilus assembly protein TadD
MSETYDRAKEIFLEACDLDAEAQAAFVVRACAGDAALRSEVETLLIHYRTPTASIVRPEAPGPGAALPRSFGPYRVVREIGRGGMGVVYAAVRDDEAFKRRVAIKVLKRGMDSEEVFRRFVLERQVLAALNHPGIARLYEGGLADEGTPYFVMELVEGQAIHDYCDTHRLNTAERLRLFRKVCEAVHYAHQNLVIHRDLKPDNILVTKEGQPKLLDFGIARLLNPDLAFVAAEPTAPGLRVMTPEYASPEQARGIPLTTASDIYSLGVILYELLTGHRPYRLKSRMQAEIERVICEVEPEKPSTAISRVEEADPQDAGGAGTTAITPEQVSRVREGRPERLRRCLVGDIDNVVLMAMRKEPQRRYRSAEQLAEDIERHLAGLPVIARPDTVGYRMAKFVRRHRAGVAAAAVIAFLLVGALIVVSAARASEARQRLIAVAERAEAVAQRDRAERIFERSLELTDTMVSELNDRIAPLDGAVSARHVLATAAVSSLEGLVDDIGDNPDLKRQLAAAYDKMGDILGGVRNPSLGKVSEAMESYRRGLELRRELMAAHPGDREIRSAVAVSCMHIGDLLAQSGNVDGAMRQYQEALELAETLAQEDPAGYASALDNRLIDMGAAMVKLGRLGEAERFYDRALQLQTRLAADDPGNPNQQRSLSVALIRSAGIAESFGDFDKALALNERAIAIRQALADGDRDSARYRRDLSLAHYFTGLLELKRRRLDRAEHHARTFMALAEQGLTGNPDLPRFKQDVAISHELLGRVLAQQGDVQGALDQYRQFQSAITTLSESEPRNTQYRRRVADSHERMGEVHVTLASPAGAVGEFARALEILTGLSSADPHDARLKSDQARLLLALGQALLEDGNALEARRRLESARALYAALLADQPRTVELRDGLAETERRLATLE